MTRARALDFLIGGTFAVLLALSAAMKVNPSGGLTIAGASLGEMCTFHRIASINCPFCGMSRSLVSLFDGRIHDSLCFHPLGVCVAAVFALTAMAAVVGAVRRRMPVIETRTFSVAIYTLIAASLCLWALGGRQHCSAAPLIPKEVAE
ncbi:MAG: DUF2752 domain-containing protein [Verrucomicrobia bacterium]|jgi:hypothetical protein|nr:DUF2752 domain-containing protein [Verrucomicrobiota bacterium]